MSERRRHYALPSHSPVGRPSSAEKRAHPKKYGNNKARRKLGKDRPAAVAMKKAAAVAPATYDHDRRCHSASIHGAGRCKTALRPARTAVAGRRLAGVTEGEVGRGPFGACYSVRTWPPARAVRRRARPPVRRPHRGAAGATPQPQDTPQRETIGRREALGVPDGRL